MQIYGPFRVSTTQAAGPPQQARPAQPQKPAAGGGSSPVDQLDLSGAASGVNRLGTLAATQQSGEIRVDRVADLRRQIASGSYDTPEKLDSALDKFLDQYA